MKIEIGKTYLDGWDKQVTIAGYTKDNRDWVYSIAGDWYEATTGKFLYFSKRLGHHTFSVPTNRDIVKEIKNDET